jgi:hypothetical protein
MRRILLAMSLMAQSTLTLAAGPSAVEVRDLRHGERYTCLFVVEAGQLMTARLEPFVGQMDPRLVGPVGRVVADAPNIESDPARVRREAQLSLAKNPRFRHPYHWGAFVRHGGWR